MVENLRLPQEGGLLRHKGGPRRQLWRRTCPPGAWEGGGEHARGGDRVGGWGRCCVLWRLQGKLYCWYLLPIPLGPSVARGASPVCLSSSTERSLQGPHTLRAGQDHPQLRAFLRTCDCRPLGSCVLNSRASVLQPPPSSPPTPIISPAEVPEITEKKCYGILS